MSKKSILWIIAAFIVAALGYILYRFSLLREGQEPAGPTADTTAPAETTAPTAETTGPPAETTGPPAPTTVPPLCSNGILPGRECKLPNGTVTVPPMCSSETNNDCVMENGIFITRVNP